MIPVATTHFLRTLPGAPKLPCSSRVSRVHDSRSRVSTRICHSFSRHGLRIAQFGNGAERVLLLDVILRFPLCAQFQTDAVDALNPDTIAVNDGWLLGDAVSGSRKGESLASAALGERRGRSSVPANICSVAVSGLGEDHRPVRRGYRKPHLVAGWKPEPASLSWIRTR